jgi:hypothetical protein
MSSGRLRTVRVVQRLRTLSEARCYGWRGGDTVEVKTIASHALPDQSVVSGELLRALFEDRLDTREPEAA